MIYKCFMHCDRVCLNNLNLYIYVIINDIMTSGCVSRTILSFWYKYTHGH